MSAFCFAAEEDKKAFEIRIPDVAEYTKEELLGYEKEILGVYVSDIHLMNIQVWSTNI